MDEANETAKKYAEALKQQSQYLIDQQNQAKQNTLSSIENERLNAINTLNAGKDTIRQQALDNAKQANINRMLALKDNQGAMNRAGLGTQGIVGSQVNSINNNYGTNLNSIIRDRTNQLKSVDDQVNSANIQYDTNRLNAINQYDANIADLQSQIDAQALNQYNTIYSQMLAQKQQEWQNQLAELERQEAIRQYNLNLALQQSQLEFEKQQAQQSQNNWLKEYKLQEKQINFTKDPDFSEKTDFLGNNEDTMSKKDYYFTSSTGEDYQPRYINNVKLRKTGKKLGNIATIKGISSSKNIWEANGKYYVWDEDHYVDVSKYMK